MGRNRGPSKPVRQADAILGADLHLWPRAPKCREQDEWLHAIDTKLQYIAALQQLHNAPFLVAGDIFEKSYMEKGDQWFFSWLMDRISNWICIPGQHDLANHRLEAYPESNLAVLERARVVRVSQPHDRRWEEDPKHPDLGVFSITGFGWGDAPIPPEYKTNEEHKNIALIHHLVYAGKPPFPGAEVDGSTARALMRKMKGFDLIVSGDNHEQFACRFDQKMGDFENLSMKNPEYAVPNGRYVTSGQLLVNPGSMMRTSAKQVDHQPAVFLWYADTNTVERVPLPIVKDAVSRNHLDRQERHDEKLEAFVERLGGDVDMDLSFSENVRRRVKESDVTDGTKEIIEEALA